MPKKLSETTLAILEAALFLGDLPIQWMFDRRRMATYGPKNRINIQITFNNLQRRGFLKKSSSKTNVYSLTSKGKTTASRLMILKKIKNKKWNKKWYMLIFDIPETKKAYRQRVRKIIKEMGFFQLQKSVWVFPYNILEYLYQIMPGFREGDWFEYLEVRHFSSENKLKKHFNL